MMKSSSKQSKQSKQLLKAQAQLDQFLIENDINAINKKRNLYKIGTRRKGSVPPELVKANNLFLKHHRLIKKIKKLQIECGVVEVTTSPDENEFKTPPTTSNQTDVPNVTPESTIPSTTTSNTQIAKVDRPLQGTTFHTEGNQL